MLQGRNDLLDTIKKDSMAEKMVFTLPRNKLTSTYYITISLVCLSNHVLNVLHEVISKFCKLLLLDKGTEIQRGDVTCLWSC